MDTAKKLDGAELKDAAARLTRYAVAGLGAQGGLCQADAAKLLLEALWPSALDWQEPRHAADHLVTLTVAAVARTYGLPPADAGRELLRAVARWFGIDFEREVERIGEDAS